MRMGWVVAACALLGACGADTSRSSSDTGGGGGGGQCATPTGTFTETFAKTGGTCVGGGSIQPADINLTSGACGQNSSTNTFTDANGCTDTTSMTVTGTATGYSGTSSLFVDCRSSNRGTCTDTYNVHFDAR